MSSRKGIRRNKKSHRQTKHASHDFQHLHSVQKPTTPNSTKKKRTRSHKRRSLIRGVSANAIDFKKLRSKDEIFKPIYEEHNKLKIQEVDYENEEISRLNEIINELKLENEKLRLENQGFRDKFRIMKEIYSGMSEMDTGKELDEISEKRKKRRHRARRDDIESGSKNETSRRRRKKRRRKGKKKRERRSAYVTIDTSLIGTFTY